MKKPIKRIIIVGGGSAGWMSAAVLSKRFPHFEIALVESPDVPIIGVGESTLGSINLFLSMLELKDSDWMEYCNATYKLSIKFRDFYKKGETFYYPFGDKDTKNTINGIHDWYMKKVLHPDTPINDFYESFYSVMPLIYDTKICDNSNVQLSNFNFQNDAAYHMDAALFGEFLREKVCMPNGVVHIKEHIEQFKKSSDGYLESLVLRNGDELEADLYLDCTGFKSLILEKTMNIPFHSFSKWLPNDRAWVTHVPYTDKEVEMENVTNCTAIDNGWVWNIPLYSRIGSGYVFCNKYISEEDALEQYKQYLDSDQMKIHNPNRSKDLEFRLIEIKNGVHATCWYKNVVGVGLSYGFIEPLESTGLLSVQEILLLLCETLSNEQINRVHVDNFNYIVGIIMNGFKVFVAYHYTLSSRRDTKYWQYITEELSMDSRMSDKYVAELHTLASDYASRLIKTHNLGADMGGAPDIFVGMHTMPMNRTALDHHLYLTKVQRGKEAEVYLNSTQNYWNQKKAHAERIAKESPNHYHYLRDKFYKGKP
jgi:tryptophan halogenase